MTDDEDEEERRRRYEAKHAAENFGAAIGLAVDLAVASSQNTKEEPEQAHTFEQQM